MENKELISYMEMEEYLKGLSAKCITEKDSEIIESTFFYINEKREELNKFKKIHQLKMNWFSLIVGTMILYWFDAYCYSQYQIHLSFNGFAQICMTLLFMFISVVMAYILAGLLFSNDFYKSKFKK